MKIHLLCYDDGFDKKVERASCDGEKMGQLEEQMNGVGCSGSYYCQSIELEDCNNEEI